MLYDKRWDVEPEVKLEPWRQLLLDAANLLERDGWCQFVYFDDDGNRCLAGALETVSQRESFDRFALIDSRREAWDRIAAVTGTVVEWNDTRGRTAEEVISTLRKVAGA